ncbi:MAG TPA: head maturation protease, ClpP-related, partial [Candidatus Eisenbacteria bacterium]|nr:head maturation protease, ClpP-related [Candidatus Eisenbacteria bacterium]
MKSIRRACVRPQAALNWLAKNNIQDVAAENVLSAVWADNGERAVITLSGTIGKSWWDDSGITAKEFEDALNEIPNGKKILVRVNSEGGSVKEGLQIYDSIEARAKDITVRIVGYALSIASVFPLAASRIESPDHSIWMIHEGWMTASGNKRDMRKNAELLEIHDKVMEGKYAKRTGGSIDYWRAKMESETWFTGREAIEAGLADESGDESEPKAENHRPIFAEYLASCKNVPPNILNALSAAPKQGAVKPPTPQENTMNKKLIVALLKDHGIEASETETEDQLNAKLAQIPKAAKKEATAEQKTAIAKADSVSREEFDKLQAQLTAQSRARVEDKVNTY